MARYNLVLDEDEDVQRRRRRSPLIASAVALVAALVQPMVPGTASADTVPGARASAVMSEDPGSGTVVLWGGETPEGDILAGTVTWDGRAWSGTADGGPSPEQKPSMAYDGARNKVLLLKHSDLGLISETWSWDGTTRTWTMEMPVSSPPARYGGAMAYDAATDTVVLFGGFDGLYQNDTWIWDGGLGNWINATPVVSPPPRIDAAMAYDEVTRKVVLFGGQGLKPEYDDTWIWDGASRTWIQQSPEVSPPPTADAPMAYHRASGKVVLFGGQQTPDRRIPHTDDTWTWDGATGRWTLENPSISPPSRRFHTTAYHSGTQMVIVHGGHGHSKFHDDTWGWDGSEWYLLEGEALPTLSVGDVAVHEGDDGTRPLAFTLSLSAPSASTISVPYEAGRYGTIGAGDIEPQSGTATFPPGAVKAVVKVPARGDVLDEPDEYVVLQLRGGADLTVVDGWGKGWILDDDPTTVAGPRLAIGDATVHEGDVGTRPAVFTISLSQPTTSTVTVNYATVAGTATTADFVSRSGTVSFAPGTISRTVKVAVNADTSLRETDETFTVKLSAASGATLTDRKGLGTIADEATTE